MSDLALAGISFGVVAAWVFVGVVATTAYAVGRVKLKKKATPQEIISAWRDSPTLSKIAAMKLPSAPSEPVFYDERVDRPQPRLDIGRGGGMTTTCGRLRPCNLLDWKFTVLSHNTVRGAAGAAILNAELLKVKGYLD